MNILFVCSRNNWRSPTAEAIFKHRQDLNVKSAGTEPSARIKVTSKIINWADIIFVMEKRHKQRLTEKFQDLISEKTVFILDIPDVYEYMDSELTEILKTSVEPYLDNV